MNCQNVDAKNMFGKRKRSDSYRGSSIENSHAYKMPRVEHAKFNKERSLKRMRSQSVSLRRKKYLTNGQGKISLPFKFFHGGSIDDPLNLNGLINRGELSNSVTPAASPMIVPKGDVLLPIYRYANIHDPLNLCGEYPDNILNKPKHRTRKRRYSNKKLQKVKETESCGEKLQDVGTVSQDAELTKKCTNAIISDSDQSCESSANKECPKENYKTIVSQSVKISLEPVNSSMSATKHIPSDAHSLVSAKFKSKSKRSSKSANIKLKSKNITYRFGNCSCYVGYCNPNNCDARVDLLVTEMLENKCILDIGCNVGHVAIRIAKELKPTKVLGVDIDPHLIRAAKKNLEFYCNLKNVDPQQPRSMKTLYGPLLSHPLMDLELESTLNNFPFNIDFGVGNYVPLSEFEAREQKAEFDVIIAFGVTKYIHLNYGDEGLKRTFIKMYQHLRPGGKLILQTQQWSCYKGKKRLSEEIFKTYKSIKFFPPQFKEFLLSSVGFSECHHLADIQLYNRPKGFHQSIFKYVKPQHDVMQVAETDVLGVTHPPSSSL